MVDLGVIKAASQAVVSGQQHFVSGKASLSARAAAVIALEALGFGASAVQCLLDGLKAGVLDGGTPQGLGGARLLPAGKPAGASAGSGRAANRARDQARQRVLEVAHAFIQQVCTEKALQAAASLLSAVNSLREQRGPSAAAAAAALYVDWESRLPPGGRTCLQVIFQFDAVRMANDLGTLAQLILTFTYGVVASVHALNQYDNASRDAIVQAVLSELERSKVLDVAAGTLLAMPTPAVPEMPLILPVLTRAASAMACSASLLADLAFEAGMSGTESGGSSSRQAVLSRNGGARKETHRRLCALLTQPSLARMQRALLERFSLNGGGGAAGGGSGWRMMDALRLDRELVEMYDSEDASEPAGASGQVIALLILATPALTTWASICLTPALHRLLPADMDDCLARALGAVLQLAAGQGDSAGGFGRPFAIHAINPALLKAWDCTPGVRSCHETPYCAREGPIQLEVTPAALEVLARQLAVQGRLALTLRGMMGVGPAADGSGAAARTTAAVLATAARASPGCWVTLLADTLALWRRSELTKGWNALDRDAQEDAIRRLSRADLLPSLEFALRVCAPYAELPVVYDIVMPASNAITHLFMFPILLEQMGAADAAGPIGGAAAADDPRVNLSPLLTISKVAARLSRQLDDATAAATAAHGLARGSAAAAAAHDDIQRLRFSVCTCYKIFVNFCCGVGPLGYDTSLARLAARPQVIAVSEAVVRSAITAVRSYLASVEAEQRLVHRPRGEWVNSPNPSTGQQVATAVELAPAFVTALVAMDPRIVPAQELLAARLQQLLADCCGLLLDWARACDLDPSRAPVEITNTALAALLPVGVSRRSGEHMKAIRAASYLNNAVLALAAREDIAGHVCEWLQGGGAAAAEGAGAAAARAAPPPSFREALERLLSSAPAWVLVQGALDMGAQLSALLKAAATAGGGAAATAALRRAAVDCLREHDQVNGAAMTFVAPLVGMPMDAASVRRGGAAFSCMRAIPLAGLPPAEDAHGERVVPATPPPSELDRCARVKMCGNPRCANFEGLSEQALALKKCSRCKAVRYCGADCQQQHWREHKTMCGVLQAARR